LLLVTSAETPELTLIQSQFTNQHRGQLTYFTFRDHELLLPIDPARQNEEIELPGM